MRGIRAGFILVLCLAAPARAELAAGVLDGSGDTLVTFDTSAPEQFTAVHPITGLVADEHIVGIDYRYFPIGLDQGATPTGLFGLGVVDAGATDTYRLYRIDQATGAATLVTTTPMTGLDDGTDYGVDFAPMTDRLRAISDADENARVNPNNGTIAGNDTNLTPGSADVEAIAFDRVDGDAATASTLFGINTTDHTLVLIGGVDGNPLANNGVVTTRGALGITTSAAGSRNLDISPGGAAYLTATTAGTLSPDLYTVNVDTGGATLIGGLAASLRGFGVMPAAVMAFSAAETSVAEGGIATLTVTRSGAASGTATVEYLARGGSASGTDFSSAAGELSFAPEETAKTIAVTTTNDSADEPDETVTVTLSDPNATSTLGAPAIATLTITDDDPTQGPPAVPDTTAPTLTLGGAPATLSLAKLLKRGLKVTATPGEPAALEFLLLGTVRNARISAADNLTLLRRRLKLAPGARAATLKPPRRLVGKPRKTFRVRVRVIATDAAGNRRVASKRVKITVPGRASSSHRRGR